MGRLQFAQRRLHLWLRRAVVDDDDLPKLRARTTEHRFDAVAGGSYIRKHRNDNVCFAIHSSSKSLSLRRKYLRTTQVAVARQASLPTCSEGAVRAKLDQGAAERVVLRSTDWPRSCTGKYSATDLTTRSWL